MENESHLSGGCHCGRNRYVVKVPQNPSDLLVFLDNSRASRRTHAAPLAAFLQVPITLYHSATFAFYDDETHPNIKKTYQIRDETADSLQTSRRQFCGFCGTQLTAWTEEQPGQENFIAVTLGSMRDSDVDKLQVMGLIPSEEDTEEEAESVVPVTNPKLQKNLSLRQARLPITDTTVEGSPWFESMIQDSPLGRMRRQKGGHVSNGGRTRVEWEVVEIDGESTVTSSTTTESLSNPGKRKLEE